MTQSRSFTAEERYSKEDVRNEGIIKIKCKELEKYSKKLRHEG